MLCVNGVAVVVTDEHESAVAASLGRGVLITGPLPVNSGPALKLVITTGIVFAVSNTNA